MTCAEALGYLHGAILEGLHYQRRCAFSKPFVSLLASLMLALCALPAIAAYRATDWAGLYEE